MWELVGLVMVGVVLGAVAGMVPAVHTNMLAALIVALYGRGALSWMDSLNLGVVVLAMAFANTFVSFVPSTFLGVPEEGRGHEAVVLTLIGSLSSCVLTVIGLPLIMKILEVAYPVMKKYMSVTLVFAVGVLVLREEKRVFAALVMGMSGGLGGLALNWWGIR